MARLYKIFAGILALVLVFVIGGYIWYQWLPVPKVMGSNVREYAKELSVNAPIKIQFSVRMNQSQVAEAFRVQPEVEGDVSWEGGRFLVFTPKNQWEVGKKYTATIPRGVSDMFGREMAVAYQEIFTIVGPPQVSFVTPIHPQEKKGESIEEDQYPVVPGDQKITVMFDRPVRDLKDLDSRDATQQIDFLKLEPEVEGEYRWLGSNSVQFIPEKLPMATVFTASIEPGVELLDGGKTENSKTWHFKTAEPRVTSTSPSSGYKHHLPEENITIRFNQDIDLEQLRDHFEMYPSNDVGGNTEQQDGFFNGQFTHFVNDEGEKDMSVITATPAFPFQFDTTYKIVVRAGLTSKEGPLALAEDHVLEFNTVGKARLASTFPDGEEAAELYGLAVTFSTPMDVEEIKKHIKIDPELKASDPYTYDNDTKFSLDYDFRPSSTYTISWKDGLKDKAGQIVEDLQSMTFTTKQRDAYMNLLTRSNVGVHSIDTPAMFTLKTINVNRLNGVFCRVSESEFFQTEKKYKWSEYGCSDPYTFSQNVEKDLNKAVYTNIDLGEVAGSKLEKGIYYLDITSPEYRKDYGDRGLHHQRHVFFVVDTFVEVKKWSDGILVWATDFKNGAPIANASLQILNRDGEEVATGTTNDRGLYQAKMEEKDAYYVVVQGDDHWAIASPSWSTGLSAWEFGMTRDYSDEARTYGFVFTDRPIYRPNHEVHFKGIVRRDDDGRLEISKDKQANVTIYNSVGDEVHNKEYPLSPQGTFHGEFALAEDAKLGRYSVDVTVGDKDDWRGWFSRDFWVEEYKKPEYRITIDGGKSDYTDGEKLKAEVKAEYYFGGPVADGTISWNLLAEDYFFQEYDQEWYSFADSDWYFDCYFYCQSSQDFITSGDGELDNQGKFHVEHDLDLSESKRSRLYTLEARITDAADRTIAKRETWPVHKGDFYVGIRNEDYIVPTNSEAAFNLIAVDYEGNPLSGKAIDVEFVKRTWTSVKKQNVDGEYYWENETNDQILDTKYMKTNGKGKASVSFQTGGEGGLHIAKARVTDDSGHEFLSSIDLYVTSSDYVAWNVHNHDRIELTTDKMEYNLGDTAKVLVQSPFEGTVKALVTYERRGVIKSELMEISSNSHVLEVPITEDMVPNTYISVSLLKGAGEASEDTPYPQPSFKMGYANLVIDTSSKELGIDIKFDKEQYLPGDEVTVTLTAKNSDGQGVPAELAMAVIDESVLALKSEGNFDLVKYFYETRGLGVETGSNLVLLDKIYVVTGKGAKGGDGDEEEGDEKKRGEFKDTAYFNPVITTDDNGVAKLAFTLPDNLTTWRARVVGATTESLFGSDKADVKATKPLLVRPVLPRFVIAGDTVRIGAIVHNETNDHQRVNFSMKVAPVAGSSELSTHLAMEGKTQQRMMETFIVDKKAFDGKEYLQVEISAKANSGLEDVLEYKIPIHRYSIPEVIATSGVTEEQAVERVTLDTEKVDARQGTMSVKIASSIVSQILGGYDALRAYPYGCIEQLTSGILPVVLMSAMDDVIKQEIAFDEKDMEKKVSKVLQKIYDAQKFDGGWGFWSSSVESNPYLTAYVLFALDKLQQAGISVDKNVEQKGLESLRAYLFLSDAELFDRKKYLSNEQRVFGIWVLTQMGYADASFTNTLYEKRDAMRLGSKIMLADVYNLLMGGNTESGYADKRDDLLEDVISQMVIMDRTAYLPEGGYFWGSFSSEVKTNALLLYTLSAADIDHPIIPKLMAWLRTSQRLGRMETTQEMIWKFLAFKRYLERTGELDAEFDARVWFFPEEVKWLETTFKSEDAFKPLMKTVPLADISLDPLGHEFRFQKEGKGKLYYDLEVQYYLPVEEIPPRSEGMEIVRNYYAIDDLQSETPITNPKIGDTLRGELTMVIPDDRFAVVVESFLPAGFEGVNANLDTSSQVVAEQIRASDEPAEGEEFDWETYAGRAWWYFNHQEIRDDRILFFADHLPAGVYTLKYAVNVTTAGDFHHLPAHIYEMYHPEIFGRTLGEWLSIGVE